MGILTLEFLLFAAGALALYRAFRPRRWKRCVLAFASAVFLLSYAGNDTLRPWTAAGALLLLPLAAFTLAGFAAIKSAKRMKAWPLVLAICLLYAFLRYFLLGAEAGGIVTIGMSYILFRILHLLLDNSQNALEIELTLSDYLAYIFFFPTLLAGPIWRYDEYAASLDSAVVGAPEVDQVFCAFSRIANGCLKILVATRVCGTVHGMFAEEIILPDRGAVAAVYFALAAILYLLFFYFDFSGYMDIAIGVGSLFGFSISENFNAPFQSADVIDFWNRWHITLSKWMQQYLFIPLVAWLSRRLLGRVKIQYLGAVGYIAVFLVVGVWHGANVRFACFGLILGFAASATKLWDSWLLNRLYPGRSGTALRRNPLYRKAMNAGALFTVSLALSALWVDVGIRTRVDAAFVATGLAAGLVAALALNTLDKFFREILSAMEHPGPLKARAKPVKLLASLGSEFWLAFRCLAVFGIIAAESEGMHAFLYQGF